MNSSSSGNLPLTNIVNTEMIVRVPRHVRNFLTKCGIVIYLRTTLLHWFSKLIL